MAKLEPGAYFVDAIFHHPRQGWRIQRIVEHTTRRIAFREAARFLRVWDRQTEPALVHGVIVDRKGRPKATRVKA